MNKKQTNLNPASCDVPEETKTNESHTVVIWAWDDYYNIMQDVKELYEGADPDVTIEVKNIPYETFFDQLAISFNGSEYENLPDIIPISSPKLQELLRQNPDNFINLSEYVDTENYNGPAVEDVTDHATGNIHGYPFSAEVCAMYYNKAIFDKCGIGEIEGTLNWESFIDLGKRLKDEGKYLLVQTYDLVQTLLQSSGEMFYNDSNEIVYTHIEELMSKFEELHLEEIIYPQQYPLSYDEIMQLLLSGVACAVIGEPFFFKMIKNEIAESDAENPEWSVTNIPQIYYPHYNVSLGTYSWAVINRGYYTTTEHLEKITNLLQMFTTDLQIQQSIAEIYDMVPVTKASLLVLSGLTNNGCFNKDVIKFLAELYTDAPYVILGEYDQELSNKLNELIQMVIYKELTVTEAYDQFKDWTPIISDSAQLKSILVYSQPSQIAYYNGEKFNIGGMSVRAVYSNDAFMILQGKNVSISPSVVKFKNGQTEADITISYTADGVTKTTTQKVYKRTGLELDECEISQDFGESGNGAINLSSGNLTYKFEDFTGTDSLMPITIARVYKQGIGVKYCVGEDWRLNIQQELTYTNEHWRYFDKTCIEYVFDNDYPTEGGRSSIRCEKLGLDLFQQSNGKINLVDRNNNTLVFEKINGVYRLTATHQFPSSPQHVIDEYSLQVIYNADGTVSSVTAGGKINGVRPKVSFVYANNLLSSLKYNSGAETTVAQYGYSGNELISVTKCNGKVSSPYSAVTKFKVTAETFTVTDTSSKNASGEEKTLIYYFNDYKGRVSAFSIGYGENERETTDVNYRGEIKSLTNPETDVIASAYTEHNGTVSVMSFSSINSVSQYAYEIDGYNYKTPKKVLAASSRGFDYKALADKYSDTLDVYHSDFENGVDGWTGGILTSEKHIQGTKSLNGNELKKVFAYSGDSQTLYLSLWANSDPFLSEDLIVRVKVTRANPTQDLTSFDFTHKLEKLLSNKWQFTAFNLGKIENGDAIEISVKCNNVCIDDIRLTKAPYETPDGLPSPEYNSFGNIKTSYQYNPVDGKTYRTDYTYNGDNQLTAQKVTADNALQSITKYNYSNKLLTSRQVYGKLNNKYTEEIYTYTNYVQTKTEDENGVVTEYSEGENYTQTVLKGETDSPDITVKNTYYEDSNFLKEVTSEDCANSLTYNSRGYTNKAEYGYDSTNLSYNSEINFSYDTFGNLNKVAIGSANLITLDYNYKHLNKATYANGDTLTYSYDNKDRLTSVSESGESSPATITYADDSEDTVTITNSNGLTYQSKTLNADGITGEYTVKFPDTDNILKVVGKAANGAGNISTAEYYTDESSIPFETLISTSDANGRLVKIERQHHGASNEYVYDSLYRLTEKKVTHPSADGRTYNLTYGYDDITANRARTRVAQEAFLINGTQKDLYNYKYYSNGNLKAIYSENNLPVTEYFYDCYGRLIKEINYLWQAAYLYEYDTNGNITSKKSYNLRSDGSITSKPYRTDTYDYETVTADCGQNSVWRDQLKSYNNQPISYDKSGNPTKYLGKTFKWQGRKLVNADGIAMEYDINGLRVKKGDTLYFWQDNNLIAEKRGNSFIYYYYDESGVCGMNYNGNDYFFRKNILGDVLAVYDYQGTPLCRYQYDAWGNSKAFDSNGIPITSRSTHVGNINPFRYRGYYWDTDLLLYYLQSRYYDPALGRFISPDDINYLNPTNICGLNLFAYCDNNPVMYSDPYGTTKWWEWVLLGAAVAVVVAALVVATVATGGTALVAAGVAIGGALGGLISVSAQVASGEEFSVGGIAASILLGAAMGGLAAYAFPAIGMGGAASSLAVANGGIVSSEIGVSQVAAAGIATLGFILFAKDPFIKYLERGMTAEQRGMFQREIEDLKQGEGRGGADNLPKEILKEIAEMIKELFK